MSESDLTVMEAEELLQNQVVYIEEVSFSGIIIVCDGKRYYLNADWKPEGYN